MTKSELTSHVQRSHDDLNTLSMLYII